MGKVEESKVLVGRAAGKRAFVVPQGARGGFLSTGSSPGVQAEGNSMGMKGNKC